MEVIIAVCILYQCSQTWWSRWVESTIETIRVYVSVRNVRVVWQLSAATALRQELYIFIRDRGMSEDDPWDLRATNRQTGLKEEYKSSKSRCIKNR